MKDGVENEVSASAARDELDQLGNLLRDVAAALSGDSGQTVPPEVPIEEVVRGDAVEMRMLVPGRALTASELHAAFTPEPGGGGASPVTRALARCRDLVARRGGVFSIENTDHGVRITLEVALR